MKQWLINERRGREGEEESSLIDGRLGECGYLLSMVLMCGYFDFIEDRPVEIWAFTVYRSRISFAAGNPRRPEAISAGK